MNIQRPSCALVVALIATQVLGPAMLWAADQRGIRVEANRRVVISAVSGEQLMVQSGGDTKVLHFRDAVNPGDQIATGDRTVAEVLIGNRAVVTLGQSTTAQVIAVSETQTTVQIQKGSVRVAASAMALGGQGKITVQTPTGQVQTRGGIIRVMVDAPMGSAEQLPIGAAKPYRASYSPNTLVAAANTRGDIIQVEEGTAEIPGAGPGGGTLTVKSGQSATMQSGQVGSISGLVNQAGLRVGVLASAGHSKTPKEGLENLVALQITQATALGKALTGAAETGQGDSGKKDEGKNVINGATGGVALASTGLINSLFGSGATSNTPSNSPQDRSGAGYGGNNNTGFGVASANGVNVKVNGGNSLLVFTRKDPVQPLFNGIPCSVTSCVDFTVSPDKLKTPLTFESVPSVRSEFSVVKELVLIGGTPNDGHGGIAPTEPLIVRGAAQTPNSSATGFFVGPDGFYPSDRAPVKFSIGHGDISGPPQEVVSANSTFVVQHGLTGIANSGEITLSSGNIIDHVQAGGTLGQFSNLPDLVPNTGGIALENFNGFSHVDGAITATGASVVLTGGVTLDRGTIATISKTTATDTYFSDPIVTAKLDSSVAKFNGSLLSVINGPSGPTSLTVQDRLLGVYDGSKINLDPDPLIIGNKSMLSVLDAKLKGPSSVPLIDIDAAKKEDGTTPGDQPTVTVTSALVTRSTIQLDGALLEASAPLFALTKAYMTTTSHFADLAGKQAQSMLLGDTLVALNASQLLIQNGHLLNLNAATATINGYLFSLTGGSSLTLSNGALFSLTSGSSLNLNGNAFGVFGSGANTLSIDNNLCTATCFQLVNSTNQPFLINGVTPLNVAGATHNVVLPNNFNVFALVPGAPAPNVIIGANDALFKVDSTSTLTINGTKVQVQ
jgi:hypothetical protein